MSQKEERKKKSMYSSTYVYYTIFIDSTKWLNIDSERRIFYGILWMSRHAKSGNKPIQKVIKCREIYSWEWTAQSWNNWNI